MGQKFFKKNIPLLAILFALGIIFLCIAEYDSNKKTQNGGISFDAKTYTEDLEQRLCAIIEKMDGVEDVQVMITLENSSSYQFGIAPNDSAYVSSILTQEGFTTSKEPILIEVVAPKIKGVSVVCKGAENIQIRERVINLIAGTLNLTKNKIYVTE